MMYSLSNMQVAKVRFPAARRRLMLVLFLLAVLGVIVRAVYLQGLHKDFLQQRGDARYSRHIKVFAHRGMVLDRNGASLAVSTPAYAVWASVPDLELDNGSLRQLSAILEIPVPKLKQKLAESDRGFVYLKRRVSPEDEERVKALRIPGIFSQREYRRYYPGGAVSAHLVGFTDVDDLGQEGIELSYHQWLAGTDGSRQVIKDRQGRIVEDVNAAIAPQDGRDLVLSIDRSVQYLAYRELSHAVSEHKAHSGSVVVLDVRTGEVLALANYPSYNPNNLDNMPRNRRNIAVVDAYEMGSTLKPFTVAAALEADLIRPDTRFDVKPGYIEIDGARITDTHPQNVLTVGEIIEKSSNVGAAQIALKLSPKTMWNVFHQFGFGRPLQVGFRGETGGILRPYQSWRRIERATMSYGHGLTVSLLQLARAYAVFANDGEIRPVSLLKVDKPLAGHQVISVQTARNVKNMLETVVSSQGTGPKARVLGYRVAGKTGTAHELVDGHYVTSSYIASFVGFAPVSQPRFVVAVMINGVNASNGDYYGGLVAAPVFSGVMEGVLRQYGVKPDDYSRDVLSQREPGKGNPA